MAPFENLGTIAYSHFVANMAIYLAVCEIFIVKKWHYLEIWVWGH